MTYDERQLKEIAFSLVYVEHFAHGTAGHNQYILVAKMARELGFDMHGGELERNGVKVLPVSHVGEAALP